MVPVPVVVLEPGVAPVVAVVLPPVGTVPPVVRVSPVMMPRITEMATMIATNVKMARNSVSKKPRRRGRWGGGNWPGCG